MESIDSWVEHEFAHVDLGDKRLNERLKRLVTVLAQHPRGSLPEATGTPAMLKAAYRFFDNEAAAPEHLLASHIQATRVRVSAFDTVLAVQDTTSLDWTHHRAVTGLGPLENAYRQGLLVHTTLAMTPDRLPLGLLGQQVWAREAESYGKPAGAHKRMPIAQKESRKWLLGLESVIELHRHVPAVGLVCVADREADVYDLFLQERPENVDLLIRAAWDRRVEHEHRYLWSVMEQTPLGAELALELPRRGGEPARVARLRVSYRAVELRPPRHRKGEALPAVALWAVYAREEAAPEGVTPVEWLLLSTAPVTSAEEAVERLQWYSCRWGIELFHKVLKSGCAIEARQLESADRLKRCLVLYSVIAWRILYGTMLARVGPELPCTVLLEREEWEALYCRIHRVSTAPARPPALHVAIGWIAQLGGYLARRGNGEPGVTVLWRGFQHLSDLTEMYRIMKPPQLVGKA
jgi:hypothetical protein